MQLLKQIGRGLLLAGLVFLFFILAFQNLVQVPVWLKVAGRMHPMFLHFPIVLLLLSFLSFWIPFHNENVWKWFDGVRLIAALTAVITAILGLLLSMEEDRSGSVLQWHKWSGVFVALSGSMFYAFDSFFIDRRKLGKLFTVFSALAILFTGHWGAGLTHGENFLLEPVASNKKVPLEQAYVYNDLIKPIMDEKCVSCHSESNAKGGLLLDNIENILLGGKGGPLFVKGKPELSLIIRRIHLPQGDKKRMPPITKPQLADDEIALLNAWIKSGALMNKKLVDLPANDSFRMIAARFLEPSGNAQENVYTFAAADKDKLAALNTNYRVVEPLANGSPALSAHLYGRSQYTAKSLEALLEVKEQVLELSLARLPVKDKDLEIVARMPNLRKLNLNYTDVTDEGLDQINTLKNLESLSLTGTAITGRSLEKLAVLPKLTHIYTWNTAIDSLQAAGFQRKYKKIQVETGYNHDGQSLIALSPAILNISSGIVAPSTQVEIRHPIKDVEIRYTIDGSKPDSINSKLYKAPIPINDDLHLKVRVFKKGWLSSDIADGNFIVQGIQPDSVVLQTPPDDRHSDRTSDDLLVDRYFGDMNYRYGNWLGYQNNEAAIYMYFNGEKTISKVLLNMLQNTRAHVFPPISIEVEGGADKDHLKPLGKLIPDMPPKDTSAFQFPLEVKFDQAAVKLIRIVARPLKALPSWHKEKGKPAWIFVNEIIVR